MKKFTFVFTAAAVLVAAPLSAQWSTFIANNGGGAQFWDNISDDGRQCNSGFILSKSVDTSNCINQRPGGWLPYTGTAMNEFWIGSGGGVAPTFEFGPGTFTFSLIGGTSGPGGDVAGANLDWGYYDATTMAFTNLNTSPMGNATFAGNWGLWVTLTNGSTVLSSSANQFAAFRNSGNAGYVIFGLEDILIGGGSDADYNDMFFSVTAGPDTPLEIVPEPATMTLLATGLAGMAAARRRRKNQS